MRALVCAFAMALSNCLVLTACGSPPAEPPPKPQFGTWGVDTAAMDRSIRPGNDFFDYVLGSWVKKAQIRPDDTCTGTDLDIQDKLDSDIASVVKGAVAQRAAKGEVSQQIGDMYRSYMDEPAMNKRGLNPIKPFFTAIDGIVDRAGLNSVMVSNNRMHTSIDDPFPVGVTIDPHDPTRHLAVITQGGLSLGSRDYYLDQDDAAVKLRANFMAHVERLFNLAGVPDAHAQAERMLALETKMAQVQWPKERTRVVENVSNFMPRSEVEKLAAGAPLKEMFDAIGYPSNTDFQVGMPEVLTKTAQLFATEPIESWKSYMRYQVIAAYGRFLSSPISDEGAAFSRQVSGQQERAPREERAVSFVDGVMGDAVGERYVQTHFSERTKDEVLALVDNLRMAYKARIENAKWMSPETRNEALKKLAALVPKIGYPDKWEDYSLLNIVPDDLFANVRGLEDWASKKNLEDLIKPVDRIEWNITPQTNNAYYSPRLNDIVFTAAILQPPNFDVGADPAANYGNIGAIIGHEMSHAFDDQGRKSDSLGRQRDWWTPADAARYQSEVDKLVAQFNGYEPLPGVHINGTTTLGENIADLAGLRMAYDAYKRSLGGKEAPVIDGFTGDQRFFIAYASSWKKLCRPETQRIALQSDPHSPEKYRVNGIVRNMDEWYSAFGVTDSDALYLKPEDRVRVW
jgi:putative endopeptidase